VLDQDQCYVAVQSRDRRFDGWFVTAVRTTGIYCRPSCPAITPKRTNVDFFPTAAAAQQRGFRACKRCRPDASPGSPEWNVRQDVVGRAMRLIADGCVERDGVPGLARRLGYSERQLNRLMTEELGAGPLAVARAQRAHTARLLIETTDLSLTDVAFAAGFGSVRQFNDTIREVFATSPTDLRTRASSRRPSSVQSTSAGAVGIVSLRLPTRLPFAGDDVLRFLGQRALPGVESWNGTTYRRTLGLPGGDGVVSLRVAEDHVAADVRLSSWTDLGAAVQRVRRLLDLDADPEAVDAALSRESLMAALVATRPGRRAPGSVDPFETSVRAVVGQQISVAGARTVASKLVAAVGRPLSFDDPELSHVFPSAADVAGAADDAFAMPSSRRDTLRRLATAVADGTVVLDHGVDPDVARSSLLALKGIGPWTADYVVMRGLSHPDVFLGTDLGVIHAIDRITSSAPDPASWAPWRSYAVHHLWADLTASTSPAPPPLDKESTR
jgi:AraC family transcriptional regulator, regulatory protein of adaptative response / DNA-3-methyladenine glycosylase II